MKILSIGNSFSQDAHKWLHKLAKANGIELETYEPYLSLLANMVRKLQPDAKLYFHQTYIT